MSWPIGYMVWRIGDTLDFDRQIDWLVANRFEAIGFHASPGRPGQWRGLDPATASRQRLTDLRAHLHDNFARIEIHAPLALTLQASDHAATLDGLRPTLDLAATLAVDIITLHAIPPDASNEQATDAWDTTLAALERCAAQADVTVALECLAGRPWFSGPASDHVGVNLDIGHMYLSGLVNPDPTQIVTQAIATAGSALAHIHMHDVRGKQDQAGSRRVGQRRHRPTGRLPRLARRTIQWVPVPRTQSGRRLAARTARLTRSPPRDGGAVGVSEICGSQRKTGRVATRPARAPDVSSLEQRREMHHSALPLGP